MIGRNDVIDAITRCVGYDPVHAPRQSEIIENAWLEHFEIFPRITRRDLIAAVAEYYLVPDQPWPQPAAISKIARKYSNERYERSDLDSEERLAHEALCNAKAAEDPPLALPGPGTIGALRALPIAERMAEIAKLAERKGLPTAEVSAVYDRALTQAVRKSAPPAPLPCPDCGATERCDCEDSAETAAEMPEMAGAANHPTAPQTQASGAAGLSYGVDAATGGR